MQNIINVKIILTIISVCVWSFSAFTGDPLGSGGGSGNGLSGGLVGGGPNLLFILSSEQIDANFNYFKRKSNSVDCDQIADYLDNAFHLTLL